MKKKLKIKPGLGAAGPQWGSGAAPRWGDQGAKPKMVLSILEGPQDAQKCKDFTHKNTDLSNHSHTFFIPLSTNPSQ